MKHNTSDDYSDDGIAQRLNFNTPDKNPMMEWKMSNGEEYTRRLFDSGKKVGELRNNIVLVMPFFDDEK